jgi:hypothetical protein
MITPSDQDEFRTIVHHAKLEGWLEQSASMTVVEAGASVLVERMHAGPVLIKSYPRDSQWPYQVLRDLADGLWRGPVLRA